MYEGDEHVGLPTTCLIAGANSIVGSIWPVIDRETTKFSTGFYKYYLSGMSPAQAVTQYQRQAEKDGEHYKNWAGYICMGLS